MRRFLFAMAASVVLAAMVPASVLAWGEHHRGRHHSREHQVRHERFGGSGGIAVAFCGRRLSRQQTSPRCRLEASLSGRRIKAFQSRRRLLFHFGPEPLRELLILQNSRRKPPARNQDHFRRGAQKSQLPGARYGPRSASIPGPIRSAWIPRSVRASGWSPTCRPRGPAWTPRDPPPPQAHAARS